MNDERFKKSARTLRPASQQPLRRNPRDAKLPLRVNQPFTVEGESVPHGITGNRFAFPIPAEANGPIRSKDARRRKGLEGY